MTATATSKSNVGGIALERPFQIRRLGHIGLNLNDYEAGKRFYIDLLGFRVSDLAKREIPDPKAIEGMGDPTGYFLRYASDHHALVLANKRVNEVLRGPRKKPDITVGQVSWQVQSLRECMLGGEWWRDNVRELNNIGRGSWGNNYHAYVDDGEGHNTEIFYGMEQVGWNGYTRPTVMFDSAWREEPSLPQRSEWDEVTEHLDRGTDLLSGYRHRELPAKYDVDGILLARPFKIIRHGPVKLFLEDMEQALEFYEGAMGFRRTEEVTYAGEKVVFLHCGVEHHSLALYPMALRSKLGLSEHTTLASLGVQVANYQQLRNAVDFLRENGVRVETNLIPQQLHPGIDYAAYAFDPDGHCMELYYYMEQLGWDQRPRPAEQRRNVDPNNWPEVLDAMSDTYAGDVFMGPWQ